MLTCSLTWPMNASEAGGDLVFACQLISIFTQHIYTYLQGHPQPHFKGQVTGQRIDQFSKTIDLSTRLWEIKMKMHPAKTKYSVISTRQKIANSPKQTLDLSVDGMQLTKVESERVLGVYIDSHLTWNDHIDILRRKLLQTILGRARRCLRTK